MRIQEVKDEAKKWAEVAAKAKDDAKDLQTLVEELKANAAEKDLRLEELQKRNDEQSILHTGSKDANIEDDATTLPQDGSNVDAPPVKKTF